MRPATQLRTQDLVFGSEVLVAQQQFVLNLTGDQSEGFNSFMWDGFLLFRGRR